MTAEDHAVVAVLREQNASRVGLARQVVALRAEVARLRDTAKRAEEWRIDAIRSREGSERAHRRLDAAEARVRTLEEALRVLTSATDEVLRGWDAKRQLDSGFTGMGHNILTEKVGKYSSIYCWEQGRKGVEEARAALRGGK